MYTGNQNRAREEKNLDALLQMTSDNPAVYIPKGPQRGNSNLMAEKNTNSSISELHTGSAYTPKGPPKGNPNLMAEKNRNYPNKGLYTGSVFSTDNYLNLNNYSNLNKVGGYGGGMQDISAQRGPGGSGGGSEDTEGNMDANQLLELNPYLSKNVTSFNDGGMFGELAKYNHGGTVGSVGLDGTNYSVGPYKSSNKSFSPNYDGGAEENRINKIRSNEFLHQNKLNPYQLSPTSGSSNPYGDAFNRELKKRQNDSWLESLKDGSWGGTQDRIDLKNPWEEGYDNWYGQAKNGMRMPEYSNGGMMPQQQMPQQTESYAKQANDMIALAQLEAFGKKFASQMPQEAANGMKRLYQQGGNYPHNMYNKETGYKIVAQNEAAHTKLASNGFDHTPKAKYGMKMKKYTQGGRF